MRFSFLCISLGLLQSTLVLSAPQNPTVTTKAPDEPQFTALTRRTTHRCDKESWMAQIEAQAWADAGALANEAFKWDPKGKYQDAMDLYMGKNSVDDPYKGKVVIGLQNERDAHVPNKIIKEVQIHIYCGDAEDSDNKKAGTICTKKNKKGETVKPFATTWVNRGWFYNNYNMVLCPRFFAEKDSLVGVLGKMSNGQIDRNNGSAYKFTWGHTYYHEMMHMDPLVSPEETWDYAYGACKVSKLAAANGCEHKPWPGKNDPKASSLLNADSWAMFASSVFFQEAFSLAKPGQPDCSTDPYSWDEQNPEGYWDGATNLTDFMAQPPEIATVQNTAPTPSLPFDPNAPIPSGLATPYADAVAYFDKLLADNTKPPGPKTRDTDMGIVTCRSENNDKTQGGPGFYTLEKMNEAINEACENWRSYKAVFGAGGIGSESTATKAGVVITAEWNGGDNCPAGLDFSKDNGDAAVEVCKQRLGVPVNACDTASNGNEKWKQGGDFFRDCMTWQIGNGLSSLST